MDSLFGSLGSALSLIVLAGCSASQSDAPGFGDAASDGASASDAAASSDVVATGDAADVATDAGPLGAPCTPDLDGGAGHGCPTGLSCFPRHTAATWGCDSTSGCQPDLYGHCYATCANGAGGESACSALVGLCGCPVVADPDAGVWPCAEDLHPPAPLACVANPR